MATLQATILPCCPRCGQTLPINIPECGLGVQQRVVVQRVVSAGSAGISSIDLFEYVHNGSEGGPITYLGSLSARIVYINRKLHKVGKVIKNVSNHAGRGNFAVYVMQDLPKEN
jgi:hypothetical protein